jgi:hypothetical protein
MIVEPLVVAQVLVGIVVGGLAAALHLFLVRRAAAAVLRTKSSASAYLGLPLRIAIPALALLGLAAWGPPALLAGALAFPALHRLGIRRSRPESGG